MLRLFIGVLLCLLVGMLVAMLMRGENDDKSPPTVRQIILSALCFQGAAIALVWRLVRVHQISWAEAFGLRNAWVRAGVFGMIAIVVFLPLASALQHFSYSLLEHVGIQPTTQQAVQALHHAGQGVGLVAFALVTVVIAPLGEELLFRGVLYPAIKRAGFPKLALWGSMLTW